MFPFPMVLSTGQEGGLEKLKSSVTIFLAEKHIRSKRLPSGNRCAKSDQKAGWGSIVFTTKGSKQITD